MYDRADGGSGSGGTGGKARGPEDEKGSGNGNHSKDEKGPEVPPTGDPDSEQERTFDSDAGREEETAQKSQLQARLLQPSDLTAELLALKPLHSPSPTKWINRNGKISIDSDGNWIYTNDDGISVRYVQGFPDFKEAGLVIRQVDVGQFRGYYADFTLAEQMIANDPIIGVVYTWHHMQDGHTLQAVNRAVHRQFTHRGGMSGMKRRENND